MSAIYGSETLAQVTFVTGVIGGTAAWFTGHAIAGTWRPFWHLLLYVLLLGAAVRFVHFALSEADLIAPASYAVDALYLLAVGALSWRATRAAQMATQYYWLFERTGPLTWRATAANAENVSGNATNPG